jgi:hypothetical protein
VAAALTAYPVAGKRKSADLCQAFLDGAGSGHIAHDGVLRDGDAVFYGVDSSNEHIWRAVKREKRRYYYIDNAYFDATRGSQFRVAVNAFQHSGLGSSDGKRFRKLGVAIKPWRKSRSDDPVILCPQSEHFMRMLAGVDFDWTRTALSAIAMFTDRPTVTRAWNPDKVALGASLGADLEHAHALVTWSSAAAVSAVLAGVPVVCGGPCAAAPMGGDMSDLESLPQPEREQWAGVLADNQWTVDEMRSGTAWRALHG